MKTKAELLFDQAYPKGGDTPRARLNAALSKDVVPSGTRGIKVVQERRTRLRDRRAMIPLAFGRVELDASRFNRMSALLHGVVRRKAAGPFAFEPLTRQCLGATSSRQFRNFVTGEPLDRWLARAIKTGDYALGQWLLPHVSTFSRSAKALWHWGLEAVQRGERTGYRTRSYWNEYWCPAWHIDYSRTPAVLRIAPCNKGKAPYLSQDYLVLDERVRDAYKHWQVMKRLGVAMNQEALIVRLFSETGSQPDVGMRYEKGDFLHGQIQ